MQKEKAQKELNDFLETPKKKSPKKTQKNNNKGVIGFENKLWQAADKLRGNMDSAEYKHVVLGLIFLKYISDSFEEKRQRLIEEFKNGGYSETEILTELEIRDYYTAENIFWVPKKARWIELQNSSKKPEIGKLVDEAMILIEKKNPLLKDVLPKIYSRRELNKIVLGGVIDLISDIGFRDKQNRSKDILGKVYEYFLGKFAQQEGKGGGEYFTPTSVVKLLVEMIEPFKGRVFDPCCGSGGMFVQSEKFVESHGGKIGDISIYGQESNPTTWKLAKMNLAIRGIEANLGPKNADSFSEDMHPSLKADYILANPPFNMKDWGGNMLKKDIRWKYGIPSEKNANYAWVQHIIHHLSSDGIAGFVLSNGSLTSISDKKIRKAMIENDIVDCIIQLPGQLFLTTQIPACLWFISRNKRNGKDRARKNEILFIDVRKYGQMISRKTKILSINDIKEISKIYHTWKSNNSESEYKDVPGLCKSVLIEEIKDNDYLLLPARYIDIILKLEDPNIILEEVDNLKIKIRDNLNDILEMQQNLVDLLNNFESKGDNEK